MRDRSLIPVRELTLPYDPRDKISRYFRAWELTKSETADRLGIDNRITDERVFRCAVFLARKILDPVRERFGPFSPNSVYRGQALERALKRKKAPWKSHSQHTMGSAADIEVPGVKTIELARWIIGNAETYDQCILECYNPAKGPNSGWVHISLVPGNANRCKCLSYVYDKKAGGHIYVNGFVAE